MLHNRQIHNDGGISMQTYDASQTVQSYNFYPPV